MPFIETLRALDKAATVAPFVYSARPNDRPDEAPGSIIAEAASGRALAVAVAPRYSRGQFKHDAALIVLLRNSAPRLAALVEAAGTVLSDALGVASDRRQSIVSDDRLHALRAALSALEES